MRKCLMFCILPLDLQQQALVVEAPLVYHTKEPGALRLECLLIIRYHLLFQESNIHQSGIASIEYLFIYGYVGFDTCYIGCRMK